MAPLPAMGKQDVVAEPQAFEGHWHTKFHGEDPPQMLCLKSLPATEEELGRCQQQQQQLVCMLAEELFNVGYWEPVLAWGERGGGGDGPDEEEQGLGGYRKEAGHDCSPPPRQPWGQI